MSKSGAVNADEHVAVVSALKQHHNVIPHTAASSQRNAQHTDTRLTWLVGGVA